MMPFEACHHLNLLLPTQFLPGYLVKKVINTTSNEQFNNNITISTEAPSTFNRTPPSVSFLLEDNEKWRAASVMNIQPYFWHTQRLIL